MDLLRVTGGRLATDSYEFVQPVYIEGNHFDFDFHIAGWRYYNGENCLHNLEVGSKLVLEHEITNEQVPHAVMVKTNRYSFRLCTSVF